MTQDELKEQVKAIEHNLNLVKEGLKLLGRTMEEVGDFFLKRLG